MQLAKRKYFSKKPNWANNGHFVAHKFKTYLGTQNEPKYFNNKPNWANNGHFVDRKFTTYLVHKWTKVF